MLVCRILRNALPRRRPSAVQSTARSRMYREINKNHWLGTSMYELYNTLDMPFYSITVRLDMTRPAAFARKRHLSLFSLCLYGLAGAVNSVEAFRYRRLADGRVVLHDAVDLSYIILLNDKRISAVMAPRIRDFMAFHQERKLREARARMQEPVFYMNEERDLAFYSSVPWLDFTAGTQPMNTGQGYDSIPRFTTGRCTVHADGTASMPLDMHMHHGFVDGAAAGDLITALQRTWGELMETLTEDA